LRVNSLWFVAETYLFDVAALPLLVSETGARCFEPHVYLERAELVRLTGDEAAREERELRHGPFTEIGAPIRASEVAKQLDLATLS
jgi:hypothetical protein